MRRAGILRRRPQADRPARRGRARSPPRRCARALEGGQWGGPHHVSPSVLSLSQATECGTIYRVAEIEGACRHRARARHRRAHGRRAARQCAGAHERLAGGGHLEGRRRCALVRRHQRRRDGRRGGDLLRSASAAPSMQDRRKRGGALASKHRFIAAQMEAFLAGRSVAEARAPRQRDGGRAGGGVDGGRLQAGLAGRGERGLRADHARRWTSG